MAFVLRYIHWFVLGGFVALLCIFLVPKIEFTNKETVNDPNDRPDDQLLQYSRR